MWIKGFDFGTYSLPDKKYKKAKFQKAFLLFTHQLSLCHMHEVEIKKARI